MNARVARRTILAELAAGQPYPTAQATLLVSVKQLINDFSLADLVEQLGALRDARLVDMMLDPITPDDSSARRWFITTAGLAALRQ